MVLHILDLHLARGLVHELAAEPVEARVHLVATAEELPHAQDGDLHVAHLEREHDVPAVVELHLDLPLPEGLIFWPLAVLGWIPTQ